MILFCLKRKKKARFTVCLLAFNVTCKKNAVAIKVRINCVRHMLAGMYYNVVFTFGSS
jgi:hypothetical protein